MSLDWDAVVAHALALPDTVMDRHYGQPTVKANGRPVVSPGHEEGSFALHLDLDRVELLKEGDPATFWQSPHYVGWPTVLARYDSPDPARVLAIVEAARDWAIARPRPKPRRKR